MCVCVCGVTSSYLSVLIYSVICVSLSTSFYHVRNFQPVRMKVYAFSFFLIRLRTLIFLCLNANNHWLCLRVMIVGILRWVTVISSSIKPLPVARADALPLIAANLSDIFWIAFLADPLKGSWRLFEHHCPFPVRRGLPFFPCYTRREKCYTDLDKMNGKLTLLYFYLLYIYIYIVSI